MSDDLGTFRLRPGDDLNLTIADSPKRIVISSGPYGEVAVDAIIGSTITITAGTIAPEIIIRAPTPSPEGNNIIRLDDQ